jgi:hypothetical protein
VYVCAIDIQPYYVITLTTPLCNFRHHIIACQPSLASHVAITFACQKVWVKLFLRRMWSTHPNTILYVVSCFRMCSECVVIIVWYDNTILTIFIISLLNVGISSYYFPLLTNISFHTHPSHIYIFSLTTHSSIECTTHILTSTFPSSKFAYLQLCVLRWLSQLIIFTPYVIHSPRYNFMCCIMF